MQTPSLLFNTAAIHETSLTDKISLARRAGFDGLEVWAHEVVPQLLSRNDLQADRERFGFTAPAAYVEPASVTRALDEQRLTIDGLVPGTDVLRRWTGNLDDELIERINGTIAVCAELGIRYLVLPTVAEQGSHNQVAANLREIGAVARAHAVRLGLEPMGQSALIPGVKDALSVLDAAGLGDTGALVLDAFHFFRAGQPLTELASVAAEQIAVVQINDAVALPRQRLLGNRHRTFPGEGIFDVVGFCEALFKLGYHGRFSVEVLNPALCLQPADVVCRRAYRTALTVLSAAGATATPSQDFDVA